MTMIRERAKSFKLPIAIGLLVTLAGCVEPSARIAQNTPGTDQKTPILSVPAPATVPLRPGTAEALAAAAATAINPYVGGEAMIGTRTIAENCATAPNLRTLTRAAAASDTGRTLAAAGPITVFAPTDAAFERMASGAVDQLLAPANRPSLTKVMAYHVVPGAITLDQLRARIDAGGGVAHLPTFAGPSLTATKEGAAIALTDANGSKSYVETPNVQQRNGIVHVVNGVLVPRLG